MPMCPCPVDGCDYEAVVSEEQGSRSQQGSIFLPVSQFFLGENGGFCLVEKTTYECDE